MFGLLQHLNLALAYVGGISMGATAALHFARRHAEMCRALIIAGAGTGATDPEAVRAQSRSFANSLEAKGMAALRDYAAGPTRVQLRRKDPKGYSIFAELIQTHSPLGSALTLRGVQAGRSPVFQYEEELRKLDVPALVLVGDEDGPCIEPSLFLKRVLPRSGLVMFPQSGHAINLEEPELFNRVVSDFLAAVEAGRWYPRDEGSGVGFLAGPPS
jgi:pimeloyl-ACP methyl ester carboxylesterase